MYDLGSAWHFVAVVPWNKFLSTDGLSGLLFLPFFFFYLSIFLLFFSLLYLHVISCDFFKLMA